MEVPDLLRQRLDEEPRGAVALDGEDVAVFTRNRTFIYRAESLLSDARVEVYGHDIERLSVSAGRRKTTFRLDSVEGTEQFAVTSDHAEAMLEGLFGGILAAAGVLEDGESVRGVYLFSDLTVVVTDAQLVKHIGAAVWDSDYELFPFASVTGLDFEEGSVATQVVLRVDGKAERIKAPNDDAPLLQRTLTRALCAFHDVESLDQLNERLAADAADDLPVDEDDTSNSSIVLEEGISPLIERPSDTPAAEGGEEPENDWIAFDAEGSGIDSTGTTDDDQSDDDTDEESAESTAAGSERVTGTDLAALERQVTDLARAVERQNELLERQSRQLDALAERIERDE